MNTSVGRCSICGGTVTVPKTFMSVDPPHMTCNNCGASKSTAPETVIDMSGSSHDGFRGIRTESQQERFGKK